MNEIMKSCVESRKEAIVNAYKLNEIEKKEVDDLFSKIEKIGMESKDAGDFETKFATSPLNQEYLDLFTKIATANAKKATTESIATGVAKGVAESTLRNAVGTAIPTTRAAVNQKVYDTARDIPVVGQALGIKQHLDFFNKFRRKGE